MKDERKVNASLATQQNNFTLHWAFTGDSTTGIKPPSPPWRSQQPTHFEL
jgi:hypothetical protein